MFIALFIFSIVVAIMFHEFGHFATAKAFGMKAERFFLGFGPTLWSVQRGETEYGIKAIPAGGFVKIAGMSRYEEVDEADHGRLFYEQAAWKRVIVLAAGSATHFVLAFALIFAGYALLETPTATNAIAAVEPGTPAAAAGLQAGDAITAIDGTPTTDFEAVRNRIEASPGETLTLTVERNGGIRTIDVTLAAQDPGGQRQGFLGVRPEGELVRLSPLQAVEETFTGELSAVELTRLTLVGIGEAFSPDTLAAFFGSVGSDEPRSVTDATPSSLIGASQLVSELGQAGQIFGVLTLLASLNVVFGTLNMLPLPPLDGGHVAVLAVEESVNGLRRLRGERRRWHLDPAVVTPIALAVILFLVVLQVTAIYLDITNPITGIGL